MKNPEIETKTGNQELETPVTKEIEKTISAKEIPLMESLSPLQTPTQSIPFSSEKTKTQSSVFPQPCVYCGPTIKGIARQYTVYIAGVPRLLEELVKENPLAKGLIVSVEQLPETRRALEKAGTPENILYQKMQAISSQFAP